MIRQPNDEKDKSSLVTETDDSQVEVKKRSRRHYKYERKHIPFYPRKDSYSSNNHSNNHSNSTISEKTDNGMTVENTSPNTASSSSLPRT